jgi:hypothetical protein
MDHWAFVAAAYLVALVFTGALLAWAWASMRRAEAAADAITRR